MPERWFYSSEFVIDYIPFEKAKDLDGLNKVRREIDRMKLEEQCQK